MRGARAEAAKDADQEEFDENAPLGAAAGGEGDEDPDLNGGEDGGERLVSKPAAAAAAAGDTTNLALVSEEKDMEAEFASWQVTHDIPSHTHPPVLTHIPSRTNTYTLSYIPCHNIPSLTHPSHPPPYLLTPPFIPSTPPPHPTTLIPSPPPLSGQSGSRLPRPRISPQTRRKIRTEVSYFVVS